MDELSGQSPGDPGHSMPEAPRQRTRLGEFQTQLLERMRLARSDVAPAVRQLGVMTGPLRWLLNLQQASEISAPGLLVSVPMTQDWFLGLMNMRGRLISVIDLAGFQGMPLTTIDKNSRIITLAPGLAAHSGVLVSSVLGLRSSSGMQVDDTHGNGAAAWSGTSYLDDASLRWTELDLALITQDPRFMNVGR